MNRLVWNALHNAFVPAPETAKSHSKGRLKSSSKLMLKPLALLSGALASASLLAAPAVQQLPTGGQVMAGQADIQQSTARMDITQHSDKAIIHWQGFDIGAQAQVNFAQPSVNSVALNRVNAGNASQIYGQLNANGQVFLLNPNGIVFGQGSQVNVGGLVASTLDMTNQDFLDGTLRFSRGTATGSVINQGEIQVAEGGLVALLAPQVINEGIIRAQLGNVALASGDKITLDAGANGLIQMAVEPSTLESLVNNKQLIQADGGQVLMTASAADALAGGIVQNSGTVQAQSLQNQNGRILLLGDMQHGQAEVAGTLQADFVETSAAQVKLDKSLKVDTQGGHWLIDPININIDANQAQALSTSLTTGNVTVTTANTSNNAAGDINLNASISWSANTLTLRADRNIHINAAQYGSGTAGLALEYGQGAKASGNGADYYVNAPVNLSKTGSFSTKLGSDGAVRNYTIITELGEAGSFRNNQGLQGIETGSGDFVLGADINASSTASWTYQNYSKSGKGFKPLDYSNGLYFDGLGHRIDGLTIINSTEYGIGLFSKVDNGSIRNLGLTNAKFNIDNGLEGRNIVGLLIGYSNGKVELSNLYASGSLTLPIDMPVYAGGLVGRLDEGKIENSHTDVNIQLVGNKTSGRVYQDQYIGGLIGYSGASISNSYALGDINVNGSTPDHFTVVVGGLAGFVKTQLSNSYAANKIKIDAKGQYMKVQAGGLAGEVGRESNITESAALTDIDINLVGGFLVIAGGLAGTVDHSSKITNNYAYGKVLVKNGNKGIELGGLLGRVNVSGNVSSDSVVSGNYAHLTFEANSTGDVDVYGLIGDISHVTDLNRISVTNNRWLSSTALGAPSYVVMSQSNALTDAQFKSQSNFNGWNFSNVWVMSSYGPLLRALQQDATVVVDNQSKAYDGKKITNLSYQNTSSARLQGTAQYTNSAVTNAGVYALNLSGLSVSRTTMEELQRWTGAVKSQAGTLTITPKELTLNGLTADNKTYDGNANATFSGGYLDGVLFNDDVNFAPVQGAFSDQNAGQNKNVTLETLTLVGDKAENYSLIQPDSLLTANIEKAILTVQAEDQTRTYGDNNPDFTQIITGFVNNEDMSVVSGNAQGNSAASATSNVGQYAITANLDGLSADNYDFVASTTDGTLTIDKAILTVQAENQSRIYGDANPEFTQTITGFVNNEGMSVVSGNAQGNSTASATSNVGQYAITANLDGLSADNYDFVASTTDGTLTIDKAILTVQAENQSRIYGDANPEFTQTITGFVNNEGMSVVSGNAQGNSTASATSNVGQYAITANLDGLSADNYDFVASTTDGIFSITPKKLTLNGLTADNKTYDGNANATFSGGYLDGVLFNDDVNFAPVQGAFSDQNAGQNKNVTLETLTLVGDKAENYSLIQPDSLLTANIEKAILTVQAEDQTRTYGDNNPDFTQIITGFVNNEDMSVVSGNAQGNSAASATSNVGQYAITANLDGLSADNYDFIASTTDGTLTIDKAILTVQAENQSRIYGDANPEFTQTITGFVNNEGMSVVSGNAQGNSTASATSNVGQYAITANLDGLSADNYDFIASTTDGIFSITPK